MCGGREGRREGKRKGGGGGGKGLPCITLLDLLHSHLLLGDRVHSRVHSSEGSSPEHDPLPRDLVQLVLVLRHLVREVGEGVWLRAVAGSQLLQRGGHQRVEPEEGGREGGGGEEEGEGGAGEGRAFSTEKDQWTDERQTDRQRLTDFSL